MERRRAHVSRRHLMRLAGATSGASLVACALGGDTQPSVPAASGTLGGTVGWLVRDNA
ncbi:MAG: hypothetical protein M3442_15365 [Chloroflexota bacterium]|nr:hypothetical protein [Chloroflexota bacterium]